MPTIVRVVLWTAAAAAGTFVAMWVVVIVLWGWGARDSGSSSQPINPDVAAKATAELRTRSSLEAAEAEGERLVADLQTVMSAVDPGIRFHELEAENRDISGCNDPFSGTDGRQIIRRGYVGSTAIAEDQWQTIRDNSLAAARESGTELIESASSKPAEQLIILGTRDSDITIRISNMHPHAPREPTALISLSIGCHLPADKLSSPVTPTR